MSERLRGGCFCGALRFEVGDVFDAGYCHCSICRRFSGAPAVAWANAPRRSFRVVEGEPASFASSAAWERCFCATCGSQVFGWARQPAADGSDLVSFAIPCLDDPEAIRPTAHIWCDDRLPWFEVADDLPRFPDGTLTHPDRRRSRRPG